MKPVLLKSINKSSFVLFIILLSIFNTLGCTIKSTGKTKAYFVSMYNENRQQGVIYGSV